MAPNRTTCAVCILWPTSPGPPPSLLTPRSVPNTSRRACSHHEERAAVELSVSGHDSRCFGSECVVGEPGPGEVPSCSTPSVMTRFWNCCWRCFRKTSHLVRLGGRGRRYFRSGLEIWGILGGLGHGRRKASLGRLNTPEGCANRRWSLKILEVAACSYQCKSAQDIDL